MRGKSNAYFPGDFPADFPGDLPRGEFPGDFPGEKYAGMPRACTLIASRIVLSLGALFSGCSSLAKSAHFCINSSNVWMGPCCDAYSDNRVLTPPQLYSAGRPRFGFLSLNVVAVSAPQRTFKTSAVKTSIHSRCQRAAEPSRMSRHDFSGRDCCQLKSFGASCDGISISSPPRTAPTTCSPKEAPPRRARLR